MEVFRNPCTHTLPGACLPPLTAFALAVFLWECPSFKIILWGPPDPLLAFPSPPPPSSFHELSLDSRAHSCFWAGPILLFALGLSSDLHTELFQFLLQPGMDKRGGGEGRRGQRELERAGDRGRRETP